MKPFRNLSPKRTCAKKYSTYQAYKPHLAEDFNHRCGYTDCSDQWFGGVNNFHIDHFIPWKKYQETNPALKTDYSNLVYSCSHVNIAKSDKEGAFLDPCNEDYNTHFQRSDDGTIVPITPQAKYMSDALKLHLQRYKIIWMLDQLEEKMKALSELAQKTQNQEAKNLLPEVVLEYFKYKVYLY